MEEQIKERIASLDDEIADIRRKIADAKEYLRKLDELHLLRLGEKHGLEKLLKEKPVEDVQS